MLWRIFGTDKEKLKELERRISQLEELIRQSANLQEEVQRRGESLDRRLRDVEAAEAKLAQAMLELVKTLEQSEQEDLHVRSGGRRTSSSKLEDEILRILREGGPATARTIAEKLGKSREHLSRALKNMADGGKVSRQSSGKEFIYSVAAGS